MELVTLKLSEIHPYEKNPRKNDAAVNAVAESIKQCTYVAPIIVDEDHVILAGHTRYKALKKLGKTEAECIVKSGLTEEQKKKYRLLDNKTNELALWDDDLLNEELEGLDFQGFDFGFKAESSEEDGENPYTTAVNLPQYTVTGATPAVRDLYDSIKAEQLISQIDEANISEDEKEFLRIAAYRHTVIDFEAVAEYYANASKEMQELMEESALVIIDYDDAIAKGFTNLSESLEALMGEDTEDA